VPRNSRSDISLSKISLLRKALPAVKCPNCDGNLNLSNIDADMQYHCDYCGVSGIVEIVKNV
jgi:DNA-directed RNA polymerase subunit RPC12/RpoP